MKLMAMTVLAIASAGNMVDHHTPADHVRVFLGDRQAPVRRRWLDADAEERQRGDREDRIAEPHGQLDHERA